MKYFSGTRDGAPYHAVVGVCHDHLDVRVVIFNRESGDPVYEFERVVFFVTTSDPKRAVQLVLRNPEQF